MKAKFSLFLTIALAIILFSCSKEYQPDNSANEKIIVTTSSTSANYADPGGDGGGGKDEFGCRVKNTEPPMTKCIASTGSTCSTLHACQSVLKMRESGLYTEKELQQSERIGREFMENQK